MYLQILLKLDPLKPLKALFIKHCFHYKQIWAAWPYNMLSVSVIWYKNEALKKKTCTSEASFSASKKRVTRFTILFSPHNVINCCVRINHKNHGLLNGIFHHRYLDSDSIHRRTRRGGGGLQPPWNFWNSHFRAKNNVIFRQNHLIFGQAMKKIFGQLTSAPAPTQKWSRTPALMSKLLHSWLFIDPSEQHTTQNLSSIIFSI